VRCALSDYRRFMSKDSLRFLIVEDHPEVAENNCQFLQKLEPSAICTLAESPEQAIERLTLEIPDLIVVDLQYGTITGINSAKPGLDFLAYLFQKYLNLNILVYTSDPSLLKSSLKLINEHQGGFVIVNKIERRKSFLEGAKIALNGEFKIPSELRQGLILSDRELEIVALLCQECLTDKMIAEKMCLSLKTIQNCIQKIKFKLDIYNSEEKSSRVALCMEVLKRKLINF
jgi:DNA-binding NarL/FixJ family response regulator